jgi:hypothetical protein
MGNPFRTGSQLDLQATGTALGMGQEPCAKGRSFTKGKLPARGVTRG